MKQWTYCKHASFIAVKQIVSKKLQTSTTGRYNACIQDILKHKQNLSYSLFCRMWGRECKSQRNAKSGQIKVIRKLLILQNVLL